MKPNSYNNHEMGSSIFQCALSEVEFINRIMGIVTDVGTNSVSKKRFKTCRDIKGNVENIVMNTLKVGGNYIKKYLIAILVFGMLLVGQIASAA